MNRLTQTVDSLKKGYYSHRLNSLNKEIKNKSDLLYNEEVTLRVLMPEIPNNVNYKHWMIMNHRGTSPYLVEETLGTLAMYEIELRHLKEKRRTLTQILHKLDERNKLSQFQHAD